MAHIKTKQIRNGQACVQFRHENSVIPFWENSTLLVERAMQFMVHFCFVVEEIPCLQLAVDGMDDIPKRHETGILTLNP